VSDLFSEDQANQKMQKIKTPFSETLVHAIILVSVISVGLLPSLLLEMK
jgi:hypothetical protein